MLKLVHAKPKVFKVAGKQKIGSLTVFFFPAVYIKKSYFFIYNVAMALLYTILKWQVHQLKHVSVVIF